MVKLLSFPEVNPLYTEEEEDIDMEIKTAGEQELKYVMDLRR